LPCTDELKIIARRVCGRVGADFVKTSTGFAPCGATIGDLRLMCAHTNPNIQIKAADGVRTLEKALEVYQAGCSRFGATATVTILEDWKAHFRELVELATVDSVQAALLFESDVV